MQTGEKLGRLSTMHIHLGAAWLDNWPQITLGEKIEGSEMMVSSQLR
jgi:hypothetical protein